MADGERVIPDKSLLYHFPISFACLIGFGEIIRKVAADEPLALDPCNKLCGLIHVRDLSFGTDRNQTDQDSLLTDCARTGTPVSAQ